MDKHKALTTAEREELFALAEANDLMGGPSFLLRRHWHESGYGSLVRRGLVDWGLPPSGFSGDFAGVSITPAGRAALSALSSSPLGKGE